MAAERIAGRLYYGNIPLYRPLRGKKAYTSFGRSQQQLSHTHSLTEKSVKTGCLVVGQPNPQMLSAP